MFVDFVDLNIFSEKRGLHASPSCFGQLPQDFPQRLTPCLMSQRMWSSFFCCVETCVLIKAPPLSLYRSVSFNLSQRHKLGAQEVFQVGPYNV